MQAGAEDEASEPSLRKGKVKKSRAPVTDLDKKTKAKSSGINYTAIVIMVILLAPAFFAFAANVWDYVYPEAANNRLLRSRLVKCYSAANPDKLGTISETLEKYRGKEHILFSKLRAKYENYEECQ